MEALIPLSKARTNADAFQREKVGDLLLCIRCSHVECLHGSSSGSPSGLRPKSSLYVEKQTGRRIFRTSLREVAEFELHVDP